MRQVVSARCRSSGGCDGREAVLAEDGLGTTHVARQQGIAKLGLLNGLASQEKNLEGSYRLGWGRGTGILGFRV